LKPSYNVAPSSMIPVLRLDRDGMAEIAALKWGLIPHWANDPKIAYKTLNARAETVATAPAYRAVARRSGKVMR
jgi:putative SOS response-associated peptidase YedK